MLGFVLLLWLFGWLLGCWLGLLNHRNDKVALLEVVFAGLLVVRLEHLAIGDELEGLGLELMVGLDLLLDLPDGGVCLDLDGQLLTVQRFDDQLHLFVLL